MSPEVKLLALVLGGAAFAACGGSSSDGSFGSSSGGTSSSSGSSSGSQSSSGVSSSSSGGNGASSSGASSSSGGSSSGGSSSGASSSSGSSSGSTTAGYAIPLASPDGADDEYTASVTVGTAAFVMQIDTGSTTLALAGAGCTTCTGVSPLYTPSSSAKSTGQNGQSSYEDGSGWSGPIYSDSVGLGDGTPAVSIELVDISKQTKQFFDGSNDYQGILGLGPQQNAISNTTGYMPGVMAAGVASVFAFELCDGTGANSGTMWLGGDGAPGGTVTYTPLVPITDSNSYYAMNVDAVTLGTTSVVTSASATFAQPVLDTGTSLYLVPTPVYTAFQTALQGTSEFKAIFGTNTFATSGNDEGCLTDASVTDAQLLTLPPLTLSLPAMTSGQPDVTIQANAVDTYIYDAGQGQFCMAISDGGPTSDDPSTFGDAFMQSFHISVDLVQNRIGFAPTSCVAPQVHAKRRRPSEYAPRRPPRLLPR